MHAMLHGVPEKTDAAVCDRQRQMLLTGCTKTVAAWQLLQ